MKLKTTNHFLKRAWERGFPMLIIGKIERMLINDSKYHLTKNKTRVIIGKKMMKQLGIKSKAAALVIIIKEGRLLVTTFFIYNIWNYCSSTKEEIETILM